MPIGFFSENAFAGRRSAPAATVPRCGACGLAKSCRSPKIPVYGRGKRGILIVTPTPGPDGDARGKFYPHPKIAAELESVGVDPVRDCWWTGALICYPKRGYIDGPTRVDYCRPNLSRNIRELSPRVIIPAGVAAMRSAIEPALSVHWDDEPRLVGWQIPSHSPNAWICPTWNPDADFSPVQRLWFGRHIRRAARLTSPPWGADGPPRYAERVEVITDPTAAARRIRGMLMLGDFPATFDYETDRLKPDLREASIRCASICWEGKTTIAFPWAGDAVRAMREFLKSPAPKRGANIKFEDRWTRAKLGTSPRNWEFDTMLGAHIGDNRPDITGLKFQAYVRLGVPNWAKSIESYLTAAGGGGNSPNTVRRAPLAALLLYCGLDSLLEYLVSESQMAEIFGKEK